MTLDQLEAEEGLTDMNKDQPKGQRAKARAEAIVKYCREMGSKFVRTHEQHGDELFKRVTYEHVEHKKDKESISTQMTKKGDDCKHCTPIS